MKQLIMILTVGMAVACFGQVLLRRPSARILLDESAEFLKKHPSGTNEFKRTYSQQSEYEKGFELKSFLGYEFGQSYTNATSGRWVKIVLQKPFRAFTEGTLGHGEMGWLYEVELRTNLVDVTRESLSNEVDRIAVLLEKTYGIEMRLGRGSINYRYFSSPNTRIGVACDYDKWDGSGKLRMTVTNDRIRKLGEKRVEEEREKRLREKSKKFEVAEDEGADLLSSTEIIKPSVGEKKAQQVSGAEPSPRRSGLLGGGLLGGSLRARRLQRQQESEILVAREAAAKDRVGKAKKHVERLNSVKDKVAQLSDDAKALYEEDVRKASSELTGATNELKKIDDALTPEVRAQYEKEQKEKKEREERKEKAQKEYFEMLKSSGALSERELQEERVREHEREAEREAQRQQLLAIQKELKRVREAKAAAEAAKAKDESNANNEAE